jgi:hypothetical protein
MTYSTILAGSEPGTETEEEIERISNAGNLADLLERAGRDLGPAIRRDARTNLQQSPGKKSHMNTSYFLLTELYSFA